MLALLAGDAVKLQGFRKVIQADVAKGEITQDSRQRLTVIMLQQFMIRALIDCERIGKSVLPVVNVTEVDFEACQASRISLPLEDCPGALPPRREPDRIVPGAVKAGSNRSAFAPVRPHLQLARKMLAACS